MKIYPDQSQTRVIFPSSAEEKFYELCRSRLSEKWRVFYSVTLSKVEKDEGLKDNEIDFVLYHPKTGVLVVEVKGGRIKYQAEKKQFLSVNRHDEEFKIKDPFKQAMVWKSRFVRLLKKSQIKVPVTHLVCLPSVDESKFPESSEFDPQLIIGRSRLATLEESLFDIAKKSQEDYLKFDDVDGAISTLLIGRTFTTKLYIRDYIDNHEARVRDIESIHDSLVIPIVSSQRLGIEGEAGTGKTMIALLVVKHFRDLTKKVLFLSSNPILNLFLKQEIGGGDVMVDTYTNLARQYSVNLLTPPKDYTGSKSDWIQIDGPVRLKEAIAASQEEAFDVMVCDEAQDVQPFWWEALVDCLKPDSGHLYLFFDRSQGIFGSGGADKKFDPDVTLPVKQPYFPLVNNYRTTREISSFARPFRTGGGVLQSHCGRLGYVPEIVTYKDAEDCRRQIAQRFNLLIKDELIKSDEITILSARDPKAKESVLYQTTSIADIPLHLFSFAKQKKWKAIRPPDGCVGVSTVSSFKGLETKIGFLVNISEYNMPLSNPIMASLLYVAATRAKHMLYIFLREDDRDKKSLIKQALDEIETSGSLVLRGSDKDLEFSGKVNYYNPDRVGWLTVADKAFQKSNIMFFPNDVKKAGLENEDIKLGVKLRFRPKLESMVSIATDLKILD